MVTAVASSSSAVAGSSASLPPMTTTRAATGMCFDRTFPAGLVTEMARRLDAGGADQLWIIEDCFYTAGVSLAAAALSVTERLQVGLGILPAVARNAAITAMEIATLCALAPGRVLPGIGHGVQSWMGQMGALTPSPLTTLEEVIVAVTRLLGGETVTMTGREVQLNGVRLDQPPETPPPVLAEPASPTYVRWALEQAGHPKPFHVAVFAPLCVTRERSEAHRTMAPWLAAQLAEPTVGLQVLPFFDDLVALHDSSGVSGLAGMPADWWAEIGPVGTLDDAAAHLRSLDDVGVHSIGLFPAPDVEVARAQVDDVLALSRR